MSETVKIRITALSDNCRRYAVMIFGIKVAVAFSRDSGAKVGYNVRMISGDIDSGGSAKNWYCVVYEGSVFELEVDKEIFEKNKNKITKWKIEEISDFAMSKERSEILRYAQENLE